MKMVCWVSACLLFVSTANAEAFKWGELKRERIDLKLPLLTVHGNKGVLACGYVNANTCAKTGEACAIVTGVYNHEQMLDKTVVDLSPAAKDLGVELGMTGAQVLELIR